MESSQRPLTLIFLTGAGTSQREQNRGTLKRLKSLQLYHLACLIVYTVVKTGGLWAPRIFQCQLNSNIIAMGDWITGGQSKPETSYSMNLQHHAVVAKSSIIGPGVRPGCILQWLIVNVKPERHREDQDTQHMEYNTFSVYQFVHFPSTALSSLAIHIWVGFVVVLQGMSSTPETHFEKLGLLILYVHCALVHFQVLSAMKSTSQFTC